MNSVEYKAVLRGQHGPPEKKTSPIVPYRPVITQGPSTAAVLLDPVIPDDE